MTPDAENLQNRLWEHYQSVGLRHFALSVPRLAYLFRRGRRRARSRRPVALNIGVGAGWLERRCLAAGWNVATPDPDSRALEAIRALGVRAEAGSIAEMPFDNGSFDLIFCSEVLEDLTDEILVAGLGEIFRCLAPGGWLVGTVPDREDMEASVVFCPTCGSTFHRWGHEQRFDRARLATLFAEADFGRARFRRRSFMSLGTLSPLYRARNFPFWLLDRMGFVIGDAKICFEVARPAAADSSRRSIS